MSGDKINIESQERQEVKIDFPSDPEKLAALLTWMFSSGDFMRVNMDKDMIEKVKQFANIKVIGDDS